MPLKRLVFFISFLFFLTISIIFSIFFLKLSEINYINLKINEIEASAQLIKNKVEETDTFFLKNLHEVFLNLVPSLPSYYYFIIFDKDKKVIAYFPTYFQVDYNFLEKVPFGKENLLVDRKNYTITYFTNLKIDENKYMLALEADLSILKELNSNIIKFNLYMIPIYFILSLIFSLIISKSLEKRQKIIRDFAVKVSLGNLNYNVSYKYKDEFEDVFLSIKIMKNNLIKLLEESKFQRENIEKILKSLPFTILTIDEKNNINLINNEYNLPILEIKEKILNGRYQKSSHQKNEELIEYKDKKFKIIRINTALTNIKLLVIILDYTEIYEIEDLKIKILRDLSHDLRTPLAITKSMIASINTQDKETEEKVKSSILYLDKLTKLINRYLNFSKLKLKKLKPNFTEVSIEEVINLVNDNAQLFSTNIIVNYPEKLEQKYFNIDIELFQQMISNIIDNANKKSNQVIIEFNSLEEFFIISIKNEAEEKDYIIIDEILNKSKETKGLGLNIIKEISILNNTPIKVEYDGKWLIFNILLRYS